MSVKNEPNRMKQFYESYKDDKVVSPLVTQISWTNHLIIMSKSKSPEERRFYVELCIREHRKYKENPSVGIILCATKDDEVVEFALSRSLSPTLVSDYTLYLPDKKLLQNKLRELAEIASENEVTDS